MIGIRLKSGIKIFKAINGTSNSSFLILVFYFKQNMYQTDISVSWTSGKPHETCLLAKCVNKSREWGRKAGTGETREFEKVLR